jgi:hypothetical protein
MLVFKFMPSPHLLKSNSVGADTQNGHSLFSNGPLEKTIHSGKDIIGTSKRLPFKKIRSDSCSALKK